MKNERLYLKVICICALLSSLLFFIEIPKDYSSLNKLEFDEGKPITVEKKLMGLVPKLIFPFIIIGGYFVCKKSINDRGEEMEIECLACKKKSHTYSFKNSEDSIEVGCRDCERSWVITNDGKVIEL